MSLTAIFRSVGARLVGPGGEVGYIEHNDQGGYSIRQFDSNHRIGNYPTYEAAAKIAKANGLIPQFLPRVTDALVAAEELPAAGALKYVIIEESGGAEHMFFCLPPSNHDELTRNRPALKTVIGAGFVTFLADGSVKTYGSSHSLSIGPSPSDALKISAMYRAALLLNPIPKPN
ncbi:MAG TPA: hypothetical protein VII43_02245 [Opitutaceae bacterium]